ncbi:MAG: pyroglutamyl-peptidase I [Clostridia bacterium]|nr:pyroglutamyl-peptidase I [Clostridia bacterium]
MKILVTGFTPFGNDTVNPSWEAVSRLPDEIDGATVQKVLLPVEYRRVRTLLEERLRNDMPDAVMCVGQAGGRAMITPEKVAINCMDASLPDQAGLLASDLPVREDGPTAYFSTLPIKGMVSAMQQSGIPGALSYSAGTYVCNSTMYHLLDLIAQLQLPVRGGFVHVPFLCEQTVGRAPSTASLPLPCIIEGLKACITAIVQTDTGSNTDVHGYTH